MRSYSCVVSVIVAMCLVGCGPRKAAPPPAMVANAIRVSAHSTPNTVEVVGVVRPFQQVELRSRVSGQITKRLFQGGQAVSANQLLYTVDPSQYQAAVTSARADLAQAQAALAQAQGDLKRYTELRKAGAIAEQTYQQSVSVAAQNAAVVAARKSALDQAQLNLSYANITSPVSGQIDDPAVDEGSLVAADQTLLGTVSTIDPVYVEFSIPEGAAINYALHHNLSEVDTTPLRMPPVTMIMPNGGTYPQKGKINFASRTVATTGTLTIRAEFPNPTQILRTGMNVRVQLLVGDLPSALLIPQRAVGDLLGRKYVFVVNGKGIVEQHMVSLGPVVGALQVVTQGLSPGDTVIVDGLQFAKPGQPMKVKIVPLSSVTAGG